MKEQPCLSGAFLQSADWASFQEAVGVHAVSALGANLFFVPLPFGLRYAYAPRVELSDATYNALALAAQKEHAVFLRVEPVTPMLAHQKFRKVRDNQPSVTRVIDLSLSEEVLLAQMKQKTRYNIRLAAKHEVVVAEAAGVWGVRRFLKLLSKTQERQAFSVHAPAYYETLLDVLKPTSATPDPKRCEARLMVARYNGKVRAANIVITYGDTVTYLHGASSEKDKEVMAPSLLQWHTMRWAKKEGFRWYDFWGIAPENAKNHPLAGVTRFKEGFGGETLRYPGTFELSLRPFWHALIRLHRRFR
ncbi:hypothetical protein A3H75_02100 [Candidatus Uhrbacteria bacterium RIFCSPLOWO2_02_FULL_51_9]|uniref:BioF2-like acetyltransferase domain-containing protein n=1 Tax=Candidatus Uhrbacteria bacterium RIFCSPLOWO2_02_FULL_51_9 TaxID=1802410 RepID=A0A1F7VEM6_9BACT|nr:MAG: hypothetical protein A3H75_02100 [Candidatus Uhrbacteria bacterium RIFCSPLOWO2_02_FULL_51_9]